MREQWTVRDGLPVNAVNDLVQDQTGYLWLATYDGLVRFDGVRFAVYRSGTHAGLPSSRITTVTEGHDGALWLSTEQRDLVRYHAGRFTHVDSLHERGGLEVFAVVPDARGRLWFGTNRGVVRAADHARRARRDAEAVVQPASVRGVSAEVLDLAFGASGAVWLATRRRGLLRVTPSGEPAQRWGPPQEVLSTHRTADGTVWAGTGTGLARIADTGGSDRRLTPVPLVRAKGAAPIPGAVLSIQSDAHGGPLWAATSEGVYRWRGGRMRLFSPASGPADTGPAGPRPVYSTDRNGDAWVRTQRALYRNQMRVFAAPHTIAHVLHDREGNTWVGTTTDGLHRLRPAAIQTIGPPEGLPSANIYPVLQTASGALWAGGIDGTLARIADGRIAHTKLDMAVWALHETPDRTLWVGGESGVCFFKRPFRTPLQNARCRTDGLPNRLAAAPSPLLPGAVRALHHDRAGRLWVGSASGLFVRRAACAAGLACWTRLTRADGLPESIVRVIHEQPDGADGPTFWMGTNGGGLVRIRPDSSLRSVDVDVLTARDGLPSNLIRAIHEDERGVLWIGTEDAGLVRLDPRTSAPLADLPLTSIRAADGLFDDVIHQILPGPGDRLWMSTNRGLFFVSRADLEAVHRGTADRVRSTSLTEQDGLRNREANGGMHPAGLRDTWGRLLFPTQGGLAVVTPSELDINTVPPPVALERLTAGDSTYALAASDAVRLPPDARDVAIAYTGLSFADPSKVHFRYRLVPQGASASPPPAWVDAGTRREALYTNVPPGRYTFQVQARNDDGVWNEEGAQMPLAVTPYLYETWGFAVACGVLVLLGALGAVQWRTRRLQQRQARLQEVVAHRTQDVRRANAQLARQAAQLQRTDEAKSEFFANISHEFRTPLTVAMGILNDWTSAPSDPLPEAAQRDLRKVLLNNRRLLRLVNQLLDVARLESASLTLHVQRLDVRDAATHVAQAFAPLAERYRITFERRLPSATPCVVADPDMLETILANLLSNAFKFTPSGGRVVLTLSHDAEAVSVTVRDTGPGIPADEQEAIFERFHRVPDAQRPSGTGIGLSLARGLAEQHGGTLTVDSTPGHGAAFTLRLLRSTKHIAARADVVWRDADDTSPDKTLPDKTLSSETLPDKTPPHETSVTAASDDQQTILVVDDNADIRAYVRRHLQPAYRVVEAADGAAGLKSAHTHLPDGIVSDVMMPKMDGLDLLSALRDDPATDFIPVILLTARAAHDDKLGGLEAGADDYLTKPFRPDELRTRIRNLIAQRMRLRERFQQEASGDGAAAKGRPLTETASESNEARTRTEDTPPLLARLEALIREHVSEEDFSVADLAAAAGMSRSKLYRDLKPLTDASPADLIWQVRVAEGRALLQRGDGTISEVAYGVGFKSVSHFARRFRERYGRLPSDFVDALSDRGD